MGVSRSGYYKWKQRKPSKRDITRSEMIAIVKATHEEHPSHGYRWTAAFIRINLKVEISDNYAYKCFRFLGIKSKTKHKEHHRPRKEKDRYPNLIFSTWETVDRPKQVIVSDMTSLKFWYFYFEVTFYFDVFTKEILSWRLAERRGSREQYVGGLTDVVALLKGARCYGRILKVAHTIADLRGSDDFQTAIYCRDDSIKDAGESVNCVIIIL